MIGRHGRRLASGLTALALCGCGSQLADPGRTRPLPAAAIPARETPVPEAAAAPAPGTEATPVAQQGPLRVSPSEIGVDVPPAESARYHTVARGDTLSGIARRYGASLDSVLDANGLDASAVLQPGQMIYIPATPGEQGASAP